jgi:hypothetical protein
MRVILIGITLGVVAVLTAPLAGSAATGARDQQAASTTSPWILHIQNYPGGISAGVRATYAASLEKARLGVSQGSFLPGTVFGRNNVQMNTDYSPAMPQNETAVALDNLNPMVAVAAANDYGNNGLRVMYTSDGGSHWGNTQIIPEVRRTGSNCGGGGDPAVAFSVRDNAFYASQLCFSDDGTSEVHVYKSEDGGQTWTPGRRAAVAVSNFSGSLDTSVFYDHEFITVDNSSRSPYFGRVYVTYVKFHMEPSGFSDYCPAQVAYTDAIRTVDPSAAVWSHTGIVPDNPGGTGKGPTANQDAIARTQADGAVDVTYVFEDCNTGLDRHLAFNKSRNGGASFMASPVRIDKPGQFEDNPNLDDHLGPTPFRAPLSPGFEISPATGTLAYLYQNNVNRAESGADISISLSHDGGLTWSDARFLSTTSLGGPAPQDQFFPAVASDEAGKFFAIWFDRRRDPSDTNIDTWQATSGDDGATWKSRRISSVSWNPFRGFFTCGCFIGDYNQIAASTAVVYPVWTDGRDSAIDQTGIGETDIFTNVEIR